MLIPSLLVMLAGCLWGCAGTVFKGLQILGMSSVLAAAYRQLIATLFVGAILLIKNRKAFRITLKQLLPLVLAGGVGSGIYNLTYFMAVAETSVSFASALSYTAPAFVTIFSLFLFKEKLTAQKLISLLLMLGGAILVTGVLQSGGVHYDTRGILLALSAGISYSLYSLFLKMAMLRGCSSETAAFYCLAFAFVFVAPMSRVWETFSVLKDPKSALLIVALGVFCAAVPSMLYSWGMARLESGKAAMIATVDLIVATVLGVVLFQDPLTAAQVVGIALILSSVLILTYKKGVKSKNVV